MLPYLIFVIALGGVSLAGFFSRSITEIGPIVIACYRISFAFIIYIIFNPIVNKASRSTNHTTLAKIYSVIVGVLFGVALALWTVSIFYTDVTNAVLISNMFPIFTVAAAVVLFKEKYDWRCFFFTVCILLGVFIVLYPDLTIQNSNLLGDVLAFLAMLAYSGYIIGSAYVGKNFKSGISYFYLLVGAITSLVILSASIESSFFPTNPSTWMYLILLGLVVQIIGQFGIVYVLAKLPTSAIGTALLLEIVFSHIWNYLFFHKTPSMFAMIGMVVMIFGAISLNMYSAKLQDLHK